MYVIVVLVEGRQSVFFFFFSFLSHARKKYPLLYFFIFCVLRTVCLFYVVAVRTCLYICVRFVEIGRALAPFYIYIYICTKYVCIYVCVCMCIHVVDVRASCNVTNYCVRGNRTILLFWARVGRAKNFWCVACDVNTTVSTLSLSRRHFCVP